MTRPCNHVGHLPNAAARTMEVGLGKVTVYRFKKYNIAMDMSQESRRWATREAIARVFGEVLEDTAIEVDEAYLSSDEPGMTASAFNPEAFSGFQTRVRS